MNKVKLHINILIIILICISFCVITIYNTTGATTKLENIQNSKECGTIKTYEVYFATKNTSYLPVENKNYKWYVQVKNSDIKGFNNNPTNLCEHKEKIIKNTLEYKQILNDTVYFKLSIFLIIMLSGLFIVIYIHNK